MLRVISVGMAVVFAGAVSTSSAAQQAGSAPEQCELHIWLTDQFAVTENMGGANLGLVGALIDEATRLKSPEGVKMQFVAQLSPSAQEEIIKDVNLGAVLAIPSYRLVIEPAERQPAWTMEQITSLDRLAKNTPNCYAELAIISNQYLKQPIGTRVRTFIRYREFDSAGKLFVKVLDTTATKAGGFPAKSEDGIAASAASLQNAFRENLIKFAKDKLKR
uniref:hypothetical protein n=1 Tax=Sphingomonas bacterium TaxID=1895847 RepID=UPI00262F6D47|nr:hypothetical protein [Sphingomonas bacterium]